MTPIAGLWLIAILGLLAGAWNGSLLCVVALLCGFVVACGQRTR